MGRAEAEVDGIKYYFDENYGARGHVGAYIYLVPCERCGREIKSLSYGRRKSYVCKYCRLGEKERREVFVDALTISLTTKEERRFNKAVDTIAKQVKNFEKYERAIEIARSRQKKYGSVPEAMAAIELVYLGYSIIPQQKVGQYHVDFYLPKEKIVLEIDGSVYHQDGGNAKRETTIQMSLGYDVLLVHVPAETVQRNIKIIDKIMKKLKVR